MAILGHQSGCCICEEPRKTVKHSGSGRVPPLLRDSTEVEYNTEPKATRNKRIKGNIGITGLASMPWFDVVLGIVPDYMHEILLMG